MARTIEKVFLGILFLLLIGMSMVFITAISYNGDSDSSFASHAPLSVKEITSTDSNEKENGLEDFDDEEVDVAITGSDLEKASAAALAYIGEGRVTDSEVGDEEGAYEIEITLKNGDEVDVHLDENFRVLSTEYENSIDED